MLVMSSRGKPSKGCAPCRTKRTKCDYGRPSCSQCLRTGRNCHGYRDPSELRFSHKTAQEFAEKEAQNTLYHLNDAIDFWSSPQSQSSGEPDSPFESILPLPSESLQFRATCYFLKNYAWERPQSSGGFLNYVPILLNDQVSTGTALMDAVLAVGLAGISSTKSCNSRVSILARERYNRALAATNRALRTDEARTDQTIITVMLLGLFETNTCDAPLSMRSWTQHIRGATQILYLRGKEQLQTNTGYKIFTQLRTQIMIHALQQHTRIPDFITQWSLANLQHEAGEDLALSKLCQLSIRVCNLRATLSSLYDFTNSHAVISAALELDSALEIWATENPYSYDTVPLKTRSNSVFADYYHVYPSIQTATTWNSYRSVRIILNSLLLPQIEHLINEDPIPIEDNFRDPLSASNKYRTFILRSRNILVELAQEICASVPFYLGDSTLSDTGSNCLHSPTPCAAGGYFLLWPLFVAACTSMVSEVMRTWVIEQLKMITDVMGIKQAGTLAYLLCLRSDPPLW
ncbi:hypothetical protein F5884DRAFT_805746 [Xylogone sp. PMI_703]|nr:hypothetical protein F5884DRAFT_805746 [Xylogone sp. PMI_703]